MSALKCPVCGHVLKWACAAEEGDAYCTALQSRAVLMGTGEETRPLCNFVGKVRRISPSEVVLVSKKEKA
jgi:hypothetical protein